jgi:photosystem II stability/assembly factor-like uncharacterized protein
MKVLDNSRLVTTVFITLFVSLFSFVGHGEPEIVTIKTKSIPQLGSRGVQFDAKNVFVTQFIDGNRYFLTQNSGSNWSELVVMDRGRKLGTYDDVRIEQWYSNYTVFSREGVFYSNEIGANWKPSPICSIVFRGSIGFRIISSGLDAKWLESTSDAGKSWRRTSSTNIWFDAIETFDSVSSNRIFALVIIKNATRGFEHRLAETSDSGESWHEVCDTENTPTLEIWATHIFFLDGKTGWLASDRDEGLFITADGGVKWMNIDIPERVVSSVYFKDRLNGRIIGGVTSKIYETHDGGKTWLILDDEEIKAASFVSFFSSQPLTRWNDFAVCRTVLLSRSK